MELLSEDLVEYAVITGASRGLGKAFAEELASKQKNLFLISLPGEGLAELGKELEDNYAIKVVCYETDLSKQENLIKVSDCINTNYTIHTLINNAGIGGTREFEEVDTSYIENIIGVNVYATSVLTHRLLPNLKKREEAFILNVSSLAGYSPIGYKTVYPASKAFVYSFSRGLNEELKDTGVCVSVVSPGPMKTNLDTSNRIEKQGFFANATLLEPKKVAKFCIQKLFAKKSVITVNPFSWFVLKLVPIRISLPIITGRFKKELGA